MELTINWRTPSRPTRARGLKFKAKALTICGLLSRPTRARGLKSRANTKSSCSKTSRPTRARGLKYGYRRRQHGDIRRAPRGRVD